MGLQIPRKTLLTRRMEREKIKDVVLEQLSRMYWMYRVNVAVVLVWNIYIYLSRILLTYLLIKVKTIRGTRDIYMM